MPPSMRGVAHGAPYFSAGNARTLVEALGPRFETHWSRSATRPDERGAVDPEVLAAVDDVDRSLIVSTLPLALGERVRSNVETALFLAHRSRCRRRPSSR